MTRALIEGLATPHPLREHLPGLYQEDDFALRLTSSLDEVLAPIFSSLDNLDSYLDPAVAPEDFLDWLAGWLGLVLDEAWPTARKRELIAKASALYRIRGTAQGLLEHIRLVTGVEIELEESGGTAWSTALGTAMPGRPGFELLIGVKLGQDQELDSTLLDNLVAAAKPAHVTHQVAIVGPPKPKSKADARPANPSPASDREAQPEPLPKSDDTAQADSSDDPGSESPKS